MATTTKVAKPTQTKTTEKKAKVAKSLTELNTANLEKVAKSFSEGEVALTKIKYVYPEDCDTKEKRKAFRVKARKDPDLPFGTDPQSEYGEGIISDNGLALHDDVNTYGEEQSPLGIHETLKRNEGSLNGGHGIFNMKKRRNIYERVSRDRNI
jgi:hypothetical protein